MSHVFAGFGFGPIQAGLFVKEAQESGRFSRMVVAEIDPVLVRAVRDNGGAYTVNVAHAHGIERVQVGGVELLDPTVEQEAAKLDEVLARATEIVTSLPSVTFYTAGGEASVAARLARCLVGRDRGPALIYTAENNNHAAEILSGKVAELSGSTGIGRVQYLNTVIGKMSRLVRDPEEIKALALAPIATGYERAFLVESFNRILVTRCGLPGFKPGISVFFEKDDLLPFEEAKLYGHNAIHALLAYLGGLKGYRHMTALKEDAPLMAIARKAFLDESGLALRRKYAHLGDDLFSEAGYRDYALDLLDRMTNPHLSDTIARAARDPVRKLGLTDRLFGTMSLAISQGIARPMHMAMGAYAGLVELLRSPEAHGVPAELQCDLEPGEGCLLNVGQINKILAWIWGEEACRNNAHLVQLVLEAPKQLADILR